MKRNENVLLKFGSVSALFGFDGGIILVDLSWLGKAFDIPECGW